MPLHQQHRQSQSSGSTRDGAPPTLVDAVCDPVCGMTVAPATVKHQLARDLASLDVAEPLLGVPSTQYAETPIGRSVSGVLLHVLEELAQHHGHLDVTRDLLR